MGLSPHLFHLLVKVDANMTSTFFLIFYNQYNLKLNYLFLCSCTSFSSTLMYNLIRFWIRWSIVEMLITYPFILSLLSFLTNYIIITHSTILSIHFRCTIQNISSSVLCSYNMIYRLSHFLKQWDFYMICPYLKIF